MDSPIIKTTFINGSSNIYNICFEAVSLKGLIKLLDSPMNVVDILDCIPEYIHTSRLVFNLRHFTTGKFLMSISGSIENLTTIMNVINKILQLLVGSVVLIKFDYTICNQIATYNGFRNKIISNKVPFKDFKFVYNGFIKNRHRLVYDVPNNTDTRIIINIFENGSSMIYGCLEKDKVFLNQFLERMFALSSRLDVSNDIDGIKIFQTLLLLSLLDNIVLGIMPRNGRRIPTGGRRYVKTNPKNYVIRSDKPVKHWKFIDETGSWKRV